VRKRDDRSVLRNPLLLVSLTIVVIAVFSASITFSRELPRERIVELPPVPIQRGATVAECDRVQPREPVATVGAAAGLATGR